MYTKEELSEIRKALPKNGFQLIADKIPGKSATAVKLVLSYPDRYQAVVFDKVAEVMKEHKAKIAAQKTKVMEAIR